MKYGLFQWRALLLSGALALVVLPTAPAHSQDTATLPSPLTPEAIDALVSRLSDQEVRDLLLQELAARAATTTADATTPQLSSVDTIAQSVTTAARQIVQAVSMAPENAGAMFAAIGSYFGTLGAGGTFRLFLTLALALAIGIAVDRIYTRRVIARSPTDPLAPSTAPAFPASVPLLARRFLREAGGALLALVAAFVVLGLALPEREARVGTTVVVWMVFFPRFAWIVLRFFLSPHRPDLRLVVTDDWTARVLIRNLVGMTVVIGLMETLLRVTREIGADAEAQRAGFWVNALIFLWLAAIFVICRNGLRSIVRGRNDKLSRGEAWVVWAYPGYGVTVIALTWIVSEVAGAIGKEDVIRQGHHFLSLGLLLLAPLCDTLIRSTVRILVPPMRGSGASAAEAYESAWQSYVRVARVLVFGAIVMILAWLWDMSLFGGETEGRFSGKFVGALLILLVGYVALEVTSLIVNRKLANETAVDVADEALEVDEGPAGGSVSRLGTILPPMSWAMQAVIIVVTVLTALGHVGVNVTALMAGAGIAGIAIGFGAQKLVADVVSGVFFLVDDAFRQNEYIDAGGVQGTVEKIALRSMLLRQSDGAIHCIPYSNVSSITNFGRDWGTMKQVFTVPFSTDIEKVRKIFKKIGQELYDTPDFTDAFIQPFKYKGVSQVNDVGIVVRGKFMFKPEKAKQFLIQREIYRRVQSDFAKAGIEFARREVRVSVDQQGGPLDDKAAHSIAMAVASSEAAAIASAAEAAAVAAKSKATT